MFEFIIIMGMIISVIGWFLGPYVAYTQGRTPWKAFLLCFFLGWIGLIIVFLLEKKKKCPMCKNKIPDKAIVCSYCGHDFRKDIH